MFDHHCCSPARSASAMQPVLSARVQLLALSQPSSAANRTRNHASLHLQAQFSAPAVPRRRLRRTISAYSINDSDDRNQEQGAAAAPPGIAATSPLLPTDGPSPPPASSPPPIVVIGSAFYSLMTLMGLKLGGQDALDQVLGQSWGQQAAGAAPYLSLLLAGLAASVLAADALPPLRRMKQAYKEQIIPMLEPVPLWVSTKAHTPPSTAPH